MRLVISIMSLTLLLSACATPERTMAGKIGCPEDEINIFDISQDMVTFRQRGEPVAVVKTSFAALLLTEMI